MHFTLADKQVGAAVVRLDKTKAVLVADDAPGFQVELIDHAHRALAVDHHLPFALHGAQAADKKAHLVGLDVQQRGQLVGKHRRAFVFQLLQDELPAGQRVVVFLPFTGQIRVLLAQGKVFLFFLLANH